MIKMASMIDEKLMKILECAICLETYEEPKVLRCQHTYCRKCLEPMVIRVGRLEKVTCPECRDESELPRGGVESLRSNFLISNLLSVNTDTQSNLSHRCEKHHKEIVELYCQECGQPICRACLEIDHRGHSYKVIKDVFPYEKRKLVNLVNEAKPKISALKAEAVSMTSEEDKVRNNALAVSQEIDSYFDGLIDDHTALLERKRQSLKQDLSDMTLVQVNKLREQKESLVSCLNSMEAAKQILGCTNKVEFLRTKNEVNSKITDLRSVAEEFKPCEKVVYKLDKKRPMFDEEMVEKIGRVRARGEYSFGMRGGEPGILYTGRALQSCNFVITRNNVRTQALGQRNVFDIFKVNILEPNAVTPFTPVVENNADGSHSFRYRPYCSGNYKISICSEEINGGDIHGSPFTWKVLPALYLRSWMCYFQNFGFRDYTYLSNCVFEEGQHSWRVRFLNQQRPQDYKCLKIGVKHPFRTKSVSIWWNGYHQSNGQDTVLSPMPESLQHGDVFVVFLNIDKRQMIMYNERTKESDIWQDVQVPVRPFLYPDVFLQGADFDVFEI